MKKLFYIKTIFFITLFFGVQNSYSQTNLDSLWRIWDDKSAHDTNRLVAMRNIIVNGYLYTNPDSAYILVEKLYELADEKDNKLYMAKGLHTMASISAMKGDYTKALDNFETALKLGKEIDNKKIIAASYYHMGNIYRNQGKYQEAIDAQTKSFEIGKETTGGIKVAAASINSLGSIYFQKGEYKKAIEKYSIALKMFEEIDLKSAAAASLNNIGIIYSYLFNYTKAIEYYSKSLKIKEESGDKNGTANSLNNIGILYMEQENHDKALEYYAKSLKIREKEGDKKGVGESFNNIGIVYRNQKYYSKSLEYFLKSLATRKGIGDKDGLAETLNNIGVVYEDQENFSIAFNHYFESLKLAEGIGNKKGISQSLLNIGGNYNKQKKYKKTIDYGNRSLAIAKEINAKDIIEQASKILWQANKELGNHSLALENHELYVQTRDSLNSEENQKAVIRQEYKFEYEKQKALDDYEHEKTIAIEKEKQRNQYIIIIISALATFLILILLLIIYRRLRLTKEQKNIIEETNEELNQTNEELATQRDAIEVQKEIVEEAHNDIKASINYAKRIQNAILPAPSVIKEHLPESFVLYKPKDVVAGDFYWLVPFSSPKGGRQNKESSFPKGRTEGGLLFAAADCTGHGVPGAMISVVCHNAMNRAVREFGLTDPGLILDKTREIVVAEFEKSEDDVKDGMDIALCSLFVEPQGIAVLQYAGAHNPLWIIRAGTEGLPILLETKADKQPIGKFDNPTPYKTHTIELQKGDSIYIFSDGYVDQFGGEKDKKFGSKRFKELLLSIQDKSMEEQKNMLTTTLLNWMEKSGSEQIDDICVMGVKIL